jgi:glycosyltransferase involved in cell wall biosynthesis
MTIKLSLIICTRNRAGILPVCLDAVFESIKESGTHLVQVIVVNNGSTDATAQTLLDWQDKNSFVIKVVDEPKPGLSRARNAGLAVAIGDLIVFTDDDCIMDRTYIKTALSLSALDSAPVMRGGRIELGDPSDLPLTIKTDRGKQTWSKEKKSMRHGTLSGAISGCNLMFPQQIYETLGDFDVALGAGSKNPGADDTDYLVRAYLAGFTIEYHPDLVVRHFHGRKTKEQGRSLMINYLIGIGGMMIKHVCTTRDVIRPFVWDIRNWVKEMRKGKNLYLPEYNLSYRDAVLYTLRGMWIYVWADKK